MSAKLPIQSLVDRVTAWFVPAIIAVAAVAFVVCNACGLNTNGANSDYIQLYQGSVETLTASLERIQLDTFDMKPDAPTGPQNPKLPSISS